MKAKSTSAPREGTPKCSREKFTPKAGASGFQEGFVPVQAGAPDRPGEDFSLSDDFWKTVDRDPLIREELEQMISTRLEKRLLDDTAEERKTLREQARQDGFTEGCRLGVEEGRALELQRIRKTEIHLNTICDQLVREKEFLLRNHEEAWCRALDRLVRHFLIPRSELVLPAVEKWLAEQLEPFSREAKIKIHVSPEDYRRLRDLVNLGAQRRWTLAEDPLLAEGDIRCECDQGGVFFSQAEQMKNLSGILEDILQEKVEEMPVDSDSVFEWVEADGGNA